MNQLQSLLECACFDFSARTLPDTLRNRSWDCAEAMELNVCVDMFIRRKFCLAGTGNSILRLLRSVAKIRHAAVHRVRISAKGVLQFLQDAEGLAALLGDATQLARISKLRRDARKVIEELERNKQFLRARLDETLRQLACQRAELQRLESVAIAEMKREDDEYRAMAGLSLEAALEGSEASFVTAFEQQEEEDCMELRDGTNGVDEDNNTNPSGGCKGDGSWDLDSCGTEAEASIGTSEQPGH